MIEKLKTIYYEFMYKMYPIVYKVLCKFNKHMWYYYYELIPHTDVIKTKCRVCVFCSKFERTKY